MEKSLTQKIHEDAQITRPDQIQVGKTYLTRHEYQKDRILDLVEHTIFGINLVKKEFYTALLINTKIANIHPMADYGIVPKTDGNWNTNTWLVLRN